ncbi:MAG: DUF1173 family protein [Burkholderiales bacterium]|nr:DUF1173 family protein [Burkholderiales bacterium]
MNAGNAEAATPTDGAGNTPAAAGRVLAGGAMVDIAAYEREPTLFAQALSKAKAEHGHALCLCAEPRPQLVVRRISGAEGDRYFLATWPNGGTAHAASCRFFRSETDYQDARAHALAAVDETVDGFNINPGFSLRRLEVAPSEAPTPARPPSAPSSGAVPVPQRDSLSLRDTLRYLCSTAGLTRHAEGRRWGDIVTGLHSVIEQGSLGRVAMRSVLYVVPVFDATRKDDIDTAWKAFVDNFQRTESAVPLFLVVGEIKTAQQAGQAVATHLRHHGPPLFMSSGLAKALANRFPREEECLVRGGAGDRVIGLFQAEISARNRIWVNDAALMRVTSTYATPHEFNDTSPA